MRYSLYNDTIKLDFNEKTHVYSVDGTRVDGTTAILGIIAKPALVYWAVSSCINYLKDLIIPGERYDEIHLKNYFKDAGSAHRRISDDAADLGTMIHTWAADWIDGKKPKMPINPQFKSSVDQFLKWVKRDQVKFIHSEHLVYSRRLKYAGTFDFLCEIDGKTYLGDFKSSSAIYDEYFLQIAGYQQAYLEEYPDFKIDGGVIVRLGKDNKLEVKYTKDYTKDVKAFNAAIVLCRRMAELKGGNKNKSDNTQIKESQRDET